MVVVYSHPLFTLSARVSEFEIMCFFYNFSYEKKTIFLTGPQDNRNKGKRKKVSKILLNSQKRPRSVSAIRKNAGSGCGTAISQCGSETLLSTLLLIYAPPPPHPERLARYSYLYSPISPILAFCVVSATTFAETLFYTLDRTRNVESQLQMCFSEILNCD
jgi:hypothetical protein